MSAILRYRSIADLPEIVPLFPLRGTILLPRAVLPLHVFEPRYVAMIDEALGSSRLVGMVQPEGHGGETGSPQGKSAPLKRIGCAGRISAFQELGDGRMFITLLGVCRFEIDSELDTASPFRLARLDWTRFAGDLVSGTGEDTVDRAELIAVLKDYLAARKLKADWNAIQRSGNESLVNSLSVISPYSPEEKQALLEAADLRARSEALVALARMELAAIEGGAGGSTLQ